MDRKTLASEQHQSKMTKYEKQTLSKRSEYFPLLTRKNLNIKINIRRYNDWPTCCSN